MQKDHELRLRRVAHATNIHRDLQSVNCEMSGMLTLGLLFHLMESDKRYEKTIDKCKEEEWDYEECVSRLQRRANDIEDTASAKPQQRATQMVGAIDTKGKTPERHGLLTHKGRPNLL